MSRDAKPSPFRSPLQAALDKFLAEKRTCGYRYEREEYRLRELDRFLLAEGLHGPELPQTLVERWTASRPHERPGTQGRRRTLVRQLALFLKRQGVPAYVLPLVTARRSCKDFTSRIFSRDEIAKLLNAADRLPYTARSPLRHLVMPEIFRVLYGCGLRSGEALRLRVRDVDLDEGVLMIREGKFRKDRLVPMADALTLRLRRYAESLGPRDSEEPFFPSRQGRRYSKGGGYLAFRRLLQAAGIPHRGRGRGPRLHEIRHSFAVHRLERWYREGANVNAKLPLLATYMGHRGMAGTQEYLQLTESLFSGLAARLDAAFGSAIPRRNRA